MAAQNALTEQAKDRALTAGLKTNAVVDRAVGNTVSNVFNISAKDAEDTAKQIKQYLSTAHKHFDVPPPPAVINATGGNI